MRHDGNLLDARRDDNANVAYSDDVWLGGAGEFVRGIHLRDDERRFFMLSPQQALSLLTWLEQERETLEQLAKENYPWNLMP